MLKPTIGQRALLLFVIVSVFPALMLNFYWLFSQQRVLRTQAEQRQVLLTQSAASRVNDFIGQKVSAAILHSQTTSVLSGNLQQTEAELDNYAKQDKDLSHILLTDKDGGIKVNITQAGKEGQSAEAAKLETETAFRVVTFLGGKEYISPVTYIDGAPHVQIAIPVLTFSEAQDFRELTTSERGVVRNSADINGALIVMVNLQSLWSSVFETDASSPTFSYIVDDKKRIIGHADAEFASSNTDLSDLSSVSYFFDDPQAENNPTIEATALNGSEALTTFARVPLTNWVVVTEEPLENIAEAANQVADRVWLINVLVAAVALGIGYVFSRQITRPIRLLAEDASEIGRGNFNTVVDVKSTDEIGSLAQSLNLMGQRLKTLIGGIAAERNQLDVVLNSISEGIFALDASGNIRLLNRSAMKLYGVSAETTLGKPFKTLATYKQDLAEVTIDTKDIDPKINVVEFRDLQFTAPDGKVRFVDILLARVAHREDEIALLATVIDQTSSRELEAMKIDFVSLAAHELRTPLTAIRGYLELSLHDKNPELSEKHRRYLLQSVDSSWQLTSLINNLLNVSKIERNALQMSMDKLDWAKTVASSVANAQFSAEKSKISLSYNGAESGVEIIGDSVAIREVIDNLIANAIHYTNENGMITVHLEVKDNEVVTSVHDTGIGISKEGVQKLFTKFYRVHGGLATGSGGSGLGLYISKSIVELHNGKIWVESVEGVGSTFSFSIPLFDPVEYEKIKASGNQTVRRKRGWITKSTTD